ncbi:MAG: phosphoglycolate phosphatase [Woeseiaceae bacterium]|nr:phosphoglycolate phosphatase [Woeseiaceae bacterium]
MKLLDVGGCSAVLFDLDGTLIDTAPDMVAVLQAMQSDHGQAPVDYELGRSYVSNGAVGLLRLGFPEADEDRIETLRPDFLSRYLNRISQASALFPGVDRLVDTLDAHARPWGVVTNKPHHLTEPLMLALDLLDRAACCVSGDTLPQRKPDPAPLHHACAVAGLDAATAIYVGDSSRDIQAGRAAGMITIAAAYGYVTPDDDAETWGADLVARDTEELAQLVLKAVNLGS